MDLQEMIERRDELKGEAARLDNIISALRKEAKEEIYALGAGNIAHRKIRTVARALLDLYQLLNEQPRELNELTRVAERGMSERPIG